MTHPTSKVHNNNNHAYHVWGGRKGRYGFYKCQWCHPWDRRQQCNEHNSIQRLYNMCQLIIVHVTVSLSMQFFSHSWIQHILLIQNALVSLSCSLASLFDSLWDLLDWSEDWVPKRAVWTCIMVSRIQFRFVEVICGLNHSLMDLFDPHRFCSAPCICLCSLLSSIYKLVGCQCGNTLLQHSFLLNIFEWAATIFWWKSPFRVLRLLVPCRLY